MFDRFDAEMDTACTAILTPPPSVVDRVHCFRPIVS